MTLSNNAPSSCTPTGTLNYIYKITTPPLIASTEKKSNQGIIKIEVTDPDNSKGILCSCIELRIPWGPATGSIFKEQPTGQANGNTVNDTSALNPALANNSATPKFFTCKFDLTQYNNVLPVPYKIIIKGAVSTLPTNDTSICISEYSKTNKQDKFQCNTNSLDKIIIQTSTFFMNNFISALASNSAVPCSEFQQKDTIQLSWEGNGTSFKVYEKNNPVPIYDSSTVKNPSCSIQIPAPVTDTTYILTSTNATNSSVIYDILTVTISNPDLTPSTLLVSDNVGIGTTTPTSHSQLTNTSLNTLGSDYSGGDQGSFAWAANQPGFVGLLYNGQAGYPANGLAVKIASDDAIAFDVSQGNQQEQPGKAIFTVRSSGKVGIGTNTPSESLEVKGRIKDITGYIMPADAIIMYNGSVGDFDNTGKGVTGKPVEGWALCNGQNGTPDLRDKFIVGAGGKYKHGDQGGQESVALTVDQLPAHNHVFNIGGKSDGSNNGPEINGPGGHYWPVSTLPTGGNQPHENRPPYYAIFYIMKL